ncbi:MAG TPA: Mur ligase family protein [Candidatus Limnocylindria bacterium]|jgi:cyanophycin synthetase
MPADRPTEPAVELLELRVLEGPNRFANRPAIKIEFQGDPEAVVRVTRDAGEVVRHLHHELGFPAPRVTFRRSEDGRRAMAAFAWRRRVVAQAIAGAAARVALGLSTERRELRGLRAVAEGPRSVLPMPRVPIVAITGTNGKSTTTRLIAHIAAAAGRRVGMTNSDGIYVRGELVEAGDWTGFGGAGRVLAEPELDLAVLETARGGILLRGIGYEHNDVSVVTNVSADHLGLQGIDTLDELAEVKGAVVRITRRTGWAVLNAEDPRVWAMRRHSRARPYAFSLTPGAPAVAEAIAEGGRAIVLERGGLVFKRPRGRRVRLVAVGDLPVTFAGLSRYNIANALAAAAACDALGLSFDEIREGLLSFAQDETANPGRLNLYGRQGVLALVDFAHNEAGLAGLLDVCDRLVLRPRGKIRLALGTAGDRTDEILSGLGRLAGSRVDDLVISEKRHYLRGRDLAQMNAIFRRAAADAGYAERIPAYRTELGAIRALLDRSHRGDIAAVMSHLERAEIFTWLARAGYRPIPLARLRALLADRDARAARDAPRRRRAAS